jgi:hypothetical protein
MTEQYLYLDGGGAEDTQTLTLDGGGAAPDQIPPAVDGGPAGFVFSHHDPPRRLATTQGDPRIILGPDGARLQFTSGQPLMDQGSENHVLISLFTRKGWCGNRFMKLNIGSDFLDECDRPITRDSLNRIRSAAERSLKHPAFGQVTVQVSNPTSYNLRVTALLERGGTLTLNRASGNWSFQALQPAYRGVTA